MKSGPEGRSGDGVKEQAIIVMVLVVALYSTHELLGSIEKVILPFVVSLIIIAIIERPVEIIYRFLTGRLDLIREARQTWVCLVHRIRSARPRTRPPLVNDSPRSSVDESDVDEAEATARLLPRNSLRAALGDGQVGTCFDSFCRGISVLIALSVVIMTACIISFGIAQAALRVKNEWHVYSDGASRLVAFLNDALVTTLKTFRVKQSDMEQTVKHAYASIASGLESMLMTMVNSVISGISGGFVFVLQVVLYTLFWLMEPLPVGGKASKIVRSYFRKKFIVCAGYGISVWLLLIAIGIDLAAFFGFVSFMLSFIPEIGPLLSMMMPTPVILLDSRLRHPFIGFILSGVGQTLLKAFWANYVEVKLVQSDHEMKMHPVWIVFGLMYFGHTFGPVGMLVAVPVMAMTKAAVLPLPHSVSGPFVACLEGRRYHPSRHSSRQSSHRPPKSTGTEEEEAGQPTAGVEEAAPEQVSLPV